MSKSLIIVESPTKARTISKFLGSDYKVESSFGHVRDLPQKKLGIQLDNNFQPDYVVPTKSKPVVKKLKEIAEKTEEVILATDEDREGEAIAWHLSQALGLENPKSKIQNPKRIVFHEITKSAIQKALENPREINMNLVNAQQARRILDRLVGYKLSPFLWKKVAKGLSAGRVQSVTLRLIVERENEIRSFVAQEYWTIVALLNIQHPTSNIQTIEANLYKIDNKTLEKFDIPNEVKAKEIAFELEKCRSSIEHPRSAGSGENFHILKIEKKGLKRNPPAPFTTSTLQQDAAKRLGFSSKRTMLIAQRLYEHGHITYMRTDSVNLSQESLVAAKSWLNKELGEKYAAEAPRVFQTKSKMAQEAHEAIRPTMPENMPKNFAGEESEKKLYKLIWQRFIASQMPQALFDSTTIIIGAGKYELRTTGTMLRFDGFLKIWPQKFEEKELPALKEGEELELKEVRSEQHFTEPPARYSEATLIKTLEEKGIGRPSTYAPTISVIQTRNYVIKEDRRFKPTEMGELVNKVLTENFPEIIDVDFTAKMEDSLDAVADGKEQWQDLLGSFYGPFSKNLGEKYVEVQKQTPTEETGEKCDKCGKPMVIRMSRFGKFIACSGFPDCRNTKKIESEKKEPIQLDLKCPKCGEGNVVVRRTRKRGKIFWGCSAYPKCDWASWENPLKEN
ncbi:MAG: type I DNA topoisomerase [Patescibacteria group bacterium]